MNILVFNLQWMVYNLSLALLPVLFVWLLLRFKNKFLKIIFGVLWFLYLPNTLYISSDIIHLFNQFGKVSAAAKVLLIAQYGVFICIGLMAFLLALYPIEKALVKAYKKKSYVPYLFVISLNFLIGFAIVLGRVERINSWEPFVEAPKVVESMIRVVTTPEFFLLSLLFGLFANLFYFLFRKKLDRHTSF